LFRPAGRSNRVDLNHLDLDHLDERRDAARTILRE